MAITTSNSIKVKPRRHLIGIIMNKPFSQQEEDFGPDGVARALEPTISIGRGIGTGPQNTAALLAA